MIKKIFPFLLVFFNLMLNAQDKLHVVSSASMFTDMLENIAGDKVVIETIVPIGSDPHLHEPTPRDAKIVRAADLILINGLTFEGWIGGLILNSGGNAVIDTITKNINAIRSTTYTGSADPHAWMDARNARIYSKNIADALIRMDPENAAFYQKNADAYDQELKDLDSYIREQIQRIPIENRVIITSHAAFSYSGKSYDLDLQALLGISTEAQVQTSDMMRVGKTIRDSGVPSIFVESTINPKLLKQIASDNNVQIGGELFADSLGEKDTPAGSYIGMMKHNTDTIVKGLTIKRDEQVKESSSSLSKLLTYGLGILVVLGLLAYFIIKKS